MPINSTKSNPNILLIQFKPVGDVLLLTPVVKALKMKYPSARISFLVNEKESILLKDFRLIDNLILVKKISKNGIANYFKYILYNFLLIKKVRKIKFDIVIDFIGNPKSALLTLLSKAPIRIGRNLGLRSIGYNKIIQKPDADTNTVLRRLAHLKPIGIDTEYIAPEIMLNKQDKKFGEDYIKSLNLSANRKIVILAPNSPTKFETMEGSIFYSCRQSAHKKIQCQNIAGLGPGRRRIHQSNTKEHRRRC